MELQAYPKYGRKSPNYDRSVQLFRVQPGNFTQQLHTYPDKSALQQLMIGECRLAHQHFFILQEFINLESLCIWSTIVYPSTVDYICTLKRLKTLALGSMEINTVNCSVTSKIADRFRGSDQLEVLRLGNKSEFMYRLQNVIEEPVLCRVIESYRGIKVLALFHMKVGLAGAQAIAKYMPLLEELRIGWNKIDDESLFYLCRGIASLRFLSVYRCFVGNEGALLLARNQPRLVHLSASHTDIQYDGAVHLLINMPQLLHFDLSKTVDYVRLHSDSEIAAEQVRQACEKTDPSDIGNLMVRPVWQLKREQI